MIFTLKNCNDSPHLCTVGKSTVYSYTLGRWPSSYTWWNTCPHCCSCKSVSWHSSPLLCARNTGCSNRQDGRANGPPPPGPRSPISAWCDRVRHESCRLSPHPESHRERVLLPVQKNTVASLHNVPISKYIFLKAVQDSVSEPLWRNINNIDMIPYIARSH